MTREQRKAVRELNRELRRATSYEAWHGAAAALDALMGNDEWQADDASPFYDDALIRRHIRELQSLRAARDFEGLATTLTESLYRVLPDISAPDLYGATHTRETKAIVRSYLDEAEHALAWLCDARVPGLDEETKRAEFVRAYENFGRSTLMLSGGATWGLYHLGVVRALLAHELLPRVICGSSMGAIVAAGVSTRADAELHDLFATPADIHRAALRLLPLRQMVQTRALMDPEQLAEHVRANSGDLTFREAFDRSGRVLNVSVSPTRARQKPRVLSYRTAPDVLVVDATVASCAIPGLFPPASLRARHADGTVVPYVPTERWVDGTLRGDLPMSRVGRLHNVNHFIVSQTNPFVVPFVASGRRRGAVRAGARIGGQLLRAQSAAVLDEVRRHVHGDRLRPFLDYAHALTDQRYLGDINIHPTFDVRMYARAMRNPTERQLLDFIVEGERAAWPALAIVRDQTRIATALERCIERLGGRVT